MNEFSLRTGVHFPGTLPSQGKNRVPRSQIHIYSYLRHLYSDLRWYVSQDTARSRHARLSCGLRQGCPLSPILFIMFINPLIKMLKKVGGVTISALTEEGACDIHVGSLWYADDGALLADSLKSAAIMLHTAHNFFLSVGMRIGADKCGLMPLFDAPLHDKNDAIDRRFIRSDKEGNHFFSTNTVEDAIEIPIVDSYKYLGLQINKHLDVANMVNKRLDGHKYKYLQLLGLFRNQYVTADLKRLATITDYIPITMYAPEVWGLGTPHADNLLKDIQRKITDLTKAAIRPGGRNPHAEVALREMGLKHVPGSRYRGSTNYETVQQMPCHAKRPQR